MTRRPALLAALVTSAALLAGCSGLAMDSTVQPGLEVGAVQADPVNVIPQPPVAGTTQEFLIRGFLRAGAASDVDYQVARSFLAANAQGAWQSDRGIAVFPDESALTFRKVSDTALEVTARVEASIDGAGRYQDLPSGSTVKGVFTLEQSTGEWRISAVPEGFGLWLSRYDVDRLYQPFSINYISTSGRVLIPDTRWFALGKGLATRLARAQLAPVPAYLRGAAKTDVPAGTRLTVDAVPLDNGLATVDLSATRPGSDPVTRQNLWAQFVQTLRQVPDVQRVALTVQGAPLELPGANRAPATLADLDFPAAPQPLRLAPIIRTGTTLRAADPDAIGDQRQTSAPVRTDLPTIGPGWVWLAMSRDGKELAAVGGDRAELSRWQGTSQIRLPTFATRLVRPTYDQSQVLWTAGIDPNGRAGVWAINTVVSPEDQQASSPQRVRVDWLDGRRVDALRISPDGQRAALITTNGTGGDVRLDVAGVVRGTNGLPSAIAAPLRVARTLTAARDVVWTSDTTLGVLGRVSTKDSIRTYVAQVGGMLGSPLASVAGARSITTTGGVRLLVVTSDTGEVYVRAGNSWLPFGEGTDFAVAAT